jgi:CMP-N-acetylneuraminic acid synthetase
MINNLKISVLIPARGGSKSIPYKNIKDIAGKPLIYWTCFAAKNSKYIDEVYVSTEDEKIKKTVPGFDMGIRVIDRPDEFAQDTSSTESVMLHFMENVGFDLLVTIQATTPFTTSEDLDTAIEKFIKEGYDSMLTGVSFRKFYWTKDGKPLNYDYLKRPRRQDWDGTITENGAFYITKREILDKYKNRLGGKIGVYEMSEDKAIDIDEPSDWESASEILLKKHSNGDSE